MAESAPCCKDRLNMELNDRSPKFFWAPVCNCTHWLKTPQFPPSPRILVHIQGRKDRRHLCVTSWCTCKFRAYTVTKSEPNEASLWKITLQKRENSHVNAGTFNPPLTRFLYIILRGKSVPVYGRGRFTRLRR